MKIIVFASGSEGNCTYIEEKGTAILIDAGISRRRIMNCFKQFDIHPDSIEGIFVTHEHYDHTKGLNTLCKYENYPIFASGGTIERIRRYIPNGDYRTVYFEARVDGLAVKSIPLPHDAAEPLGFVVESADSRLFIATDLGFVTERVIKEIDNSSALIFESNHDIDMLKNGPYPPELKDRILSRWGHLSNEQSAAALDTAKWSGLKKVVLAHLSRENNLPDKAFKSARSVLPSNVEVMVADRVEITGPFEI